LKPTAEATPAAAIASAICWVSVRFLPAGFSIQRCLPALAAATATSRWVKFGPATQTRSMSSRPMSSFQSGVVQAMPKTSRA
jgi:hypothetical protein